MNLSVFCMCYVVTQSAVPPEVTIILHPQESMSAATAYTSINLVVQFTQLYPHEYALAVFVHLLYSAHSTHKCFLSFLFHADLTVAVFLSCAAY